MLVRGGNRAQQLGNVYGNQLVPLDSGDDQIPAHTRPSGAQLDEALGGAPTTVKVDRFEQSLLDIGVLGGRLGAIDDVVGGCTAQNVSELLE